MKSNYFNFKELNSEILLTNELGFYEFLTKSEFDALISEKYHEIGISKLESLQQKYFVFDETEDVFVEKVKEYYRNMKMFIFEATCLHIFVMTNSCNMNCVYCQAQDSKQETKGLMTIETAEKAVEIALQSPNRTLSFEFQGGEPLINFNVIKHIVEYAENRKNDKEIFYTVVTNTLLLNDSIIEFFKKYEFSVSTSLDGDAIVHDSNRPLLDGRGTFELVYSNINLLQHRGIKISAIQTTTKASIKNPNNIVNAYKTANLHYLFLRPLTPLGHAREHWDEIGYTAEEFLKFYKEALNAIIKCNLEGFKLSEGHAVIFLRKILKQESDNYMELRSPCGAGIGQLTYYYDGKVYTCDEGRMLSEMGLSDFCLGNIENTYDEMMDSPVCKVTCQASVLEGIPQCCDCLYHPYCGVCPVINYSMEGSIYSREANNYKCTIYKGIMDILFECLYSDKKVTEIFYTWL